jgi:hypothetical protein
VSGDQKLTRPADSGLAFVESMIPDGVTTIVEVWIPSLRTRVPELLVKTDTEEAMLAEVRAVLEANWQALAMGAAAAFLAGEGEAEPPADYDRFKWVPKVPRAEPASETEGET